MFERLLRCFSHPTPALPVRGPAVAPGDDEPVLGCGWFNSSHDLAHGSHVTEMCDEVTPLWRWAARAQA